MDMAYLAHSIHRGHDRVPSFILAGGADDFSEVHYPQSVTYCETCHVASDDGYPEDGNAWDEGATAKSCGGCHADGLVAKDFDPITGQATRRRDLRWRSIAAFAAMTARARKPATISCSRLSERPTPARARRRSSRSG
jgi:cytochrome c553